MESKKQFNKENTLFSRRQFIGSGLSAIAATSFLTGSFYAGPPRRFKALAFDAFPIFDPRPIFTAIDRLFPEQGGNLGSQWKTSQFEYAWLRTAAGQYTDFWQVTKDALVFAARKAGLALSSSQIDELMNYYLRLGTWPDVMGALEQLRRKGMRLCFLSNLTEDMLTSNIKNSGIDPYFETVISTDQARTYKPDYKAYELGTKTLQLEKEEILFVAFAGWDACGAKWFGYPTYWLNRTAAPEEQLNIRPDAQGTTFSDLLHFIES